MSRTQNPNLSCASVFVRQSRTFHSINVLCTFYRMHTFLNWRNILSWIPFGSDLDPNRVCKCRERETERDWCRHLKVNLASADRQVEREVCVCVCVFFLNFVSFFFFLLWELVYVFQSFVSIFAKKKKSDRTRCLAVSILEYNLRPEINGSKVGLQYLLEFEVGRASESVLAFWRKNEIV